MQCKRGQAMTEFIIGLFAFVLILGAIVEFTPIFLDKIGLIKETREVSGIAAVDAESGNSSNDKSVEWELPMFDKEPFDVDISGLLEEKLTFPAMGIPSYDGVSISPVGGVWPKYNRNRTSAFLSVTGNYSIEALLDMAESALPGFTPETEIKASNTRVFTRGDSAVAAAYACEAVDGSGQCTLVIIARTAGATTATD